jgi:hypothetical protein
VVPGSLLQRLTKISIVQEVPGTIAIYKRHFAVLLGALGASIEKEPRNKRWGLQLADLIPSDRLFMAQRFRGLEFRCSIRREIPED